MKSTIFSAIAASAFATLAAAQQVGTNTAETHPSLQVSTCTKSGGCVTKTQSIVLDGNWRWLHRTSDLTNCYDGNSWNTSICPDGKTCAQNCAIEGADYSGTYGITTSGNSLSLKLVTKGTYGTNIGSRVYLMDSQTSYQLFKLKNKEFTFDVDVSNIGCGINGALYLVDMPADGGMSTQPNNKAGAKYGTGYCDAQCPHDIKFIGGEANVDGWAGSSNDPNAGKGKYGTCCTEMDIWEANNMGSAYTPHVCKSTGPYKCSGTDCGDGADRHSGVCDKDGCDFNSYRMGDTSFYGKGKTVDTTKPFTVVTQFLTADGTDSGALSEIRRLYVQNGKVIPNSMTTLPLSGGPYDSVSDKFCAAQKSLFQDQDIYTQYGGLKPMGDALTRGMVLVMSIWDDHEANMLWLDSSYPTDQDPTKPGIARGACPTDSGKPTDVETNQASSYVKFSNIKWGDIGSTYTGTVVATSPRVSPSTTTSPKVSPTSSTCANPVALNGQCGGSYYQGSTCCVSGAACKYVSAYYSQCQSSGTVTSPTPSCSGSPVSLYGQCGGQYYTGSKCCASGTCTFVSNFYSQCK
ncbi:Exoglucanase 1 [Nowakowskiella sp. JEL0407]|nr:Exoglucanase 1 [Nowakowskiella sp. JEL0407]